MPTDPYYAKGRQGYLRSPRFESAWGLVPSASGVTVAVVDTGVDLDTPELAGRILSGRDVVNGDDDPSDDEGHGTEVAGVLAAAHDGRGIAGAAPGAAILPVKVLDAQGQGTDADVAAGITWAADHGARVINLSLGGPGDSEVLREAVAYALSKDAVVVASAGNDEGTTPNYPAAIPGVLAVAATDWEGDATFFTSYGDWVDVAAPGWDLWTTARADGAKASYTSFSGTSASAPLVAATAALLRAQNPGWTQKQVFDRIVGTALDVGPRGRDPYHGAGLVDAYRALGGPAQPASAPSAGDAAEPNATPDRATAVSMNVPVWATISPQGDTDWFNFTASSTGEYLLVVQPDSYRDLRPQEFDPVVEIFDSTLRLVVRQDDGGIDAQESVLQNLAAGKYYVRVRNYAPSRSAGPYSVKIEPYGSGLPGRFLPFDANDVGSFPMSTAVGDVTGDGRADVLVATTPYGDSPYDASLLVFPQIDDGWLAQPTQVLPIGTGTQDTPALAAGDLDGDGRADAAVGTLAGVQLFKQQAGGGLAAWATLDVSGVRDLVLADVTGDGRKDIVVQTDVDGTSTNDDGIYVFAAPSWTRSGVEQGIPHGEFEVGDLNGDGRPDVAAIYETRYFASQRVDTYFQAADGTWGSGPTLTSPYFPDGIAVGDVTGDGKDDIVTASWSSRGVALFAQRSGGFAAPVGFADNGAGAVTIADMNGDGRKDVVSGNFGTLGLHLQRADGTLSPAEETGFGADTTVLPKGIAVGDFTGDGTPDVVLAPYSYGWVTFLRQRTSSWPHPVWVRNTTPAEGGTAGTSVSIVLGRAVDAARVSSSTVTVTDASSGAALPATVSYDTAARKITVQASFTSGSTYLANIDGVRDTLGNTLRDYVLRFTAGTAAADTTPPDTVIYDGPPARIKLDYELRIHHYSTEAGTRFQCSMDSGTWNDCSDHYALGGPYGQGAHTFRVRSMDGAGNVDPTPATRSWTVDPNIVAPSNDSFANAQPISGANGSVTGANVAAWYDNSSTIASNFGGCSVWYRWTASASARVTFDTVGSDFDTLLGVYTGTAPYALTSIAEDDDSGGLRTSRVTFDAVAGQEYMIAVDGYAYELNPATGQIALQWSSSATDTTPPTVSLSSPADGATVGANVPLAAAASDNGGVAKVEFLADGILIATDTSAPYSATWSTASLADGSLHRLVARATDFAGNIGTSAERTVTVDNAPPDTTITSGPTGVVASGSASFGFASSEAGSTFECALDSAPFAACTSPNSYSGLAEGQHSIRVRAIDTVGNTDPIPAERTWTVDTTAPETTIDSAPSGIVASGAASFTFSSTEAGAHFECSLDTAAFAACSSPAGYSALAEGEHGVRVRAIDAAGNTDPTPAVRTWAVDTVAPDTTLDSGPSDLTGSSSASFAFSSSEAGSRFECSFGAAAFAACSSPASYGGLADGQHGFRVRAIDAAGNVDPTPASRSWTVDTTPPETTITSAPQDPSPSRSARFDFGASEPGSSFECSLDAAVFTACASSASFAALAEGSHSFRVRSTDGVGNADPTPASYTWTIELADHEPPVVSLTSPLAGERARSSIIIAGAASDDTGIDRVEFLVNGSPVGTDSAPPYELTWSTTSLVDGPATVSLTAVDTSGNEATDSVAITIDNTLPETVLLSGPPSLANVGSSNFSFVASEEASFECSLDGAAFTGCSPPVAYSGLADGSHTFAVRAIDLAGNVEPAPAGTSWTVDTTRPETTIDSGPAGTVAVRDASFSFSATEAASFQCSLDGGPFAACFSPFSYSSLSDGQHAFLVRAIDLAGNSDETPALRNWTVDLGGSFQPPPVLCHVPNLKRKTVAAATRLAARAHCRLGKIRKAYSRRVGKGRVLAQKPRAGTTLPNQGRVGVVVSRGRRS